MNARALAFISGLLGLLTAAACSVKDDTGEYFGTTERHGKDPHTLYVNNGGEPEYVDPGKSHDSASSKIIGHLFEGLATYGPDAEAVPGVAERFERTKDNRYFRFHLRPDARWNDGKPVTAHDFEYAWKRVLDPKTASQSTPNLYLLKNAELFSTGKLLLAKEDATVRDGPRDDARSTATVKKGEAVFVIARSPAMVASKVPPFSGLPEGVESLNYDPANPKQKSEESLVLVYAKESKAVAADPGAALPAGAYDIVAVRGPVVCNGSPSNYFEIVARDGSGKRGILPGCMLGPSDEKDPTLLIARWDALPTFDPAARKEPPAQPELLGFASSSSFSAETSMLGVRATSDSTLEIEAEYPVPYILDLMCQVTAFPVRKDVIEPFNERGEPDMWTRPETIVTNGPYEVDSWRFRYEIRMRRNPHHRFKDVLKIHNIVWMAVESYVSTMNLYKAGELDYIGDNGSLPPPYRPVLAKKKDFERTNYLSSYWYEINTKVPPLDKVQVRRALNLAIDKKQLSEAVTRGGETPASHPVPDFTGGGYSEQVERERAAEGGDVFDSPLYRYNPEKARELLTEAGFKVVPDGEGFRAEGMPPIELLYNTSEGHKAIAIAIQDMWKKNLGISVQLRNEEWHVMLKNTRDRNFKIVRFGWIGDFDHPQTFFDTFMATSPNNRTGWSSAAFEQLIAKARSTADTVESMKLYRQAEKILADEVPKIPLYFYTKTTLIKPYVKGLHFNRRNEHLAQWMWLDPSWKTNKSDEPAFPVPAFAAPGDY